MVKGRTFGPRCALDPRIMAQWRVGCREPGGWSGALVRTRGAEWAGEPFPGWCGDVTVGDRRAIVGVGPSGCGPRAEGSGMCWC